MNFTSQVLTVARDAGASAVGVAGVEPFSDALDTLTGSLASGRSGPLGFTYDEPDIATDITLSLPWARSMVVFGVSYIDDTHSPAESGPIIGRFATRDHYSPVRDVAAAVTGRLQAEGARAEILIDDNRLVDRSAAVRAGIGWLGRSTMVLAPGQGPWMLLGTVATDALLDPSKPMRRNCGSCTACIPACPTGAILDGVLDARRCLSTWLQTPGSIPLWIRPLLGRRVYGCDDCLTSCPPGHPSMRASPARPAPLSFRELLDKDDDSLVERFRWWFVPRRDGRFLRRNLIVAAGNSGEAFDALHQHLDHPSSMIRGHAAWAIGRARRSESTAMIREALEAETSPEGREEMLLALMMLERPGLYAEILEADERVTADAGYVGLALLGVDPESNELPERGIELLMIDRGRRPRVGVERLAGLIRVNDRDRVAHELRRDARKTLAGSG